MQLPLVSSASVGVCGVFILPAFCFHRLYVVLWFTINCSDHLGNTSFWLEFSHILIGFTVLAPRDVQSYQPGKEAMH